MGSYLLLALVAAVLIAAVAWSVLPSGERSTVSAPIENRSASVSLTPQAQGVNSTSGVFFVRLGNWSLTIAVGLASRDASLTIEYVGPEIIQSITP